MRPLSAMQSYLIANRIDSKYQDPDMPTDDADFLTWLTAKVMATWGVMFYLPGTLAFVRLARISEHAFQVNAVSNDWAQAAAYGARRDDILKAIQLGREAIARRVAKTLLGVKP